MSWPTLSPTGMVSGVKRRVWTDARCRYEIEGDAAAWDDAEKMALKSSKSGHGKPTVSIKAKEKRKADSLGAEGESGTAKGDKANKRAKKYKDKPRKAC